MLVIYLGMLAFQGSNLIKKKVISCQMQRVIGYQWILEANIYLFYTLPAQNFNQMIYTCAYKIKSEGIK